MEAVQTPERLKRDVEGGEDVVEDFEMVTVHSPGASSSLPLPEEIFRDSSPNGGFTKQNKRMRFALIGALLIMLLALVVAVSASVRANRVASSSQLVSANRKATLEEVVEYLVGNGVSQATDLASEGTPQFKAAAWLAMYDERNMEVPFSHSLAGSHERGPAYSFVFRYVMALNYFAMGGQESWANKLNWLSGTSVCTWKGTVQGRSGDLSAGVFCDKNEAGIPMELHIAYNSLTGSIPTENGLLTSLTTLNLQSNSIEGTIPTELCALTDMSVLELATNEISGRILPRCIESLTNLATLNVAGNFLSGSLPSVLSTMSSLTSLIVEANRLTGDPIAIFNAHTDLKYLMVDRNLFTGQLDDDFLRGHRNLQILDLSDNIFTIDGFLPTHLFTMQQLEILDLSRNDLDGHIPDTFLSASVSNTKMTYLSLHHNFLNGGLPENLDRLVALNHLDVSSNKFHGPLHKQIGNMTALESLFLANNNFYEGPIPSTMASLTNLKDFSVRNAQRNGTLPVWLGALSKLEIVDLGSNDYTGAIPTELSALSNTERLILNDNKLTGSLPESLQQLTALETLILDGNKLEGDITFMCHALSNRDLIYADCEGSNSLVTCNCCKCCQRGDDDGCSSPLLATLDGSWEATFGRTNYEVYDKDEQNK